MDQNQKFLDNVQVITNSNAEKIFVLENNFK